MYVLLKYIVQIQSGIMHNIQMYTQMGYPQKQVKQAIKYANIHRIQIFDALQALQKQTAQKPSKKSSGIPSFSLLKSIHDIKLEEFEILFSKSGIKQLSSGSKQIREKFNPVGLLNVANCCYLNSLVQCYFLMGSLVRQILGAQTINNIDLSKESMVRKKRISKEYQLLNVLKEIFAKLKLSSQKHLDPTVILNHLVDSVGEKIQYGDEKDLNQINMCIIERLSQGLLYTKKYFTKSGDLSPSKRSAKQNIKRLFYGQKVQFLQNSQQRIENDFMGLILNPQYQDLFTALDAQFNYDVQVNGKILKKQTYIKQLPQYLFFNISRAQYQKKHNQLLKNNNKLTFDFIIYMDRYLQVNRQQAKITNPKIKQILQQKHKIKTELNSLQLLRNKLKQCRKIADKLTGWIDKIPKDQEFQMEKFKLEKSLQQMEADLVEIQSRKQKFVLMYIFVHRGDAVSGHYWGYGRNGKKWYRYDINCTQISQQQVLVDMETSGGIPYALVYAKPSQLEQFDYPYIKSIQDISPQKQLLNLDENNNNYINFIPQYLIKKIIQQNKQLHHIIDHQKNQKIISKLLKQYQSKYNLTKVECENAQKQNKNLKLPNYTNFATYLFSVKDEQLMKYYLYQICLESSAQIKPKQLIQNDQLLKAIQKAFRKKIKGKMTMRHFAISCQPKQNQRYQMRKDQYIIGKKCVKFIQIIHENLNKWPKVDNLSLLMKQGLQLINNPLTQIYVKNIMKEQFILMLYDLALKNNKINKIWLQPFSANQIITKQFQQFNCQIYDNPQQEQQICQKNYIPKIAIEKQWRMVSPKNKHYFGDIIRNNIQHFSQALDIYKANYKQNKVISLKNNAENQQNDLL